MNRAILRCLVGLLALAAFQPAGVLAKDTKIVLLAGVKSHKPGEHEHERTAMLLMHCIDTSLNVRHVDVEVCTNGWPEDEKTLDDADTIVLLCDGAMKGVLHPLVRDHHMAALEKQVRRGCGLVVIHWGLMLSSEIGNEDVPEVDRRVQGLPESAATDRRAASIAGLVQTGRSSDPPGRETVRNARG